MNVSLFDVEPFTYLKKTGLQFVQEIITDSVQLSNGDFVSFEFGGRVYQGYISFLMINYDLMPHVQTIGLDSGLENILGCSYTGNFKILTHNKNNEMKRGINHD